LIKKKGSEIMLTESKFKQSSSVQPKGICNIFKTILTENIPNLEKELPIQV
jgi:hypothetical protein